MKKYIINEIYADGYERFAIIQEIGQAVKLNVHFLQYDEYLENNETSRKKEKGAVLEGDVSIDLVTFSQKADRELSHNQKIQNSSHIEAVVEVDRIIDEYSLYAKTSIEDEEILIEFESAVGYKIGDCILVIGSLELKEI